MSDIMMLKQLKIKVCSKCGIEKALSEYSKSKKAKNGIRESCKLCAKALGTKNKKICFTKNIHKVYFKACNKCGILKPADQFYDEKKLYGGKKGDCIECHRKTHDRPRGMNTKNNACRVSFDYKPKFKACSECGKLKSVSNFYKSCKVKNGYHGKCKSCEAKRHTGQWEAIKKDNDLLLKHRENQKEWKRKTNKNNFCGVKFKHQVYFKKCKTCGEIKHIDEYNILKSTDGANYECIGCNAERVKRGQETRRGHCHIEITTPVYYLFCKKCGEIKHVDYYNKTDKKRDKTGYRRECGDCYSDYKMREGYGYRLGILKEDVPEGLIILHKSQLKLKRAIKHVCA